MLGLEFSPVALVNAVVGGTIGAAATLGFGLWSTREIRSDLQENLDVLVNVARGLEEAFRSGRLEFNYDDEGRPSGIVAHLSGTSPGGSSDSATVSENEGDKATGLEDDLPLDDELEIKRQRPEGDGEGE